MYYAVKIRPLFYFGGQNRVLSLRCCSYYKPPLLKGYQQILESIPLHVNVTNMLKFLSICTLLLYLPKLSL